MTDGRSRRDLLVGGAAVAAGLAVATATRDAQAQTSDVTSLNGLLSAEYQAISAYQQGIGVFQSPPPMDPNASVGPVAAAVATHFQAQHRDHAAKLSALIVGLQGTPANPSLFSAPMGFNPTVMNFLKLAANLERGAAVAYTNALSSISLQTNAQVIAAIGGVETQHFIILYLLANGLVAPTMATAMMANDVVPQSFVTAVGAGTTGLDNTAPFTFP